MGQRLTWLRLVRERARPVLPKAPQPLMVHAVAGAPYGVFAQRLIRLQRACGNRCVQKLLPSGTAPRSAQREHDERPDVAVRAAPIARADLPQGLGLGQPPSASARRNDGRAFGHDDAAVRHVAVGAKRSADAVCAGAYAAGQEIVFGRGLEAPEADAERAVLAHEPAHAARQERGRAARLAHPATLGASLSAAPFGRPQALPAVTGINVAGEVGVGQRIRADAVVAPGAGALTWTLVGAPAGITITPSGRTGATIQAPAGAAAHAAAGGTFQVQAALTATPADSFTSANITFVGISAITYTAVPPFANQGTFAGAGAAVFPPNAADPNRDGVIGNSATANVVTAPAGRPTTISLPRPIGASVAGTTITPGSQTGNLAVRVADDATRTIRDDTPLMINPVPLRLRAFTAQAATPTAGFYGALNTIAWAASDATGLLNRVVGETITPGGRDDFGLAAVVNGGPNPAPVSNLAAQANAWNDNLGTPQTFTPGVPPVPGLPAGTDALDLNNYVGRGAPAALPRVWVLRQGFHWQSWDGAWSNEFDNGIHRRSLVQRGANFGFLTEHVFPGARAAPLFDPYAGSPLITLSAFTVTPAAPPAAGGLAADGVATANLGVATTVAGRNVTWSVASPGPLAVTVPAAGAAAGVGVAATVRAGLVPGAFTIRVADSVFRHRELSGRVPVVPVLVRSLAAVPSPVPAGALLSTLAVQAGPGGRTLNWALDAASAAAGVVIAPLAPAPGAIAQSATITRPAAFTGTVRVTVSDSVLPAKRAALAVRFL